MIQRTLLCLCLLAILGCDPNSAPKAEAPQQPPTSGKVVAKWYTPGYVDTFCAAGRYYPATVPERWTIKIQSEDGRTNEIPVDSYDYHHVGVGLWWPQP